MSLDPKQFRSALGTFATGVTIVTTCDALGNDTGVTANSFNSVSLDPPLILWSLSKTSNSLAAFTSARHFAVHVLAFDQQPLSSRFAQRGQDKFAQLELQRGQDNIPLLTDCAAVFQCRMAFCYEGGDHVILVGEVIDFDHTDRTPLVFHSGRYAMALPATNPHQSTSLHQNQPDSSFSHDFLVYVLGRAHHQLFGQLRHEMSRLGLNQDGWQLLSLLGVTNDLSLQDINNLLQYTGTHINHELLEELAIKGYVILHDSYDPTLRISLTSAGRTAVIELVAIGKAAGDHATRNLSDGQKKLLSACLQQVIVDTSNQENDVSRSDANGHERNNSCILPNDNIHAR